MKSDQDDQKNKDLFVAIKINFDIIIIQIVR